MSFALEPGDELGPQKKYSVDVSLNLFVGNMAQRALTIAQQLQSQSDTAQPSIAAAQFHPDMAGHLQRVADLAQQLQAELDAIAQLDPEAFAKLKQA
jgi:hypothetical protein